jgi:class 3 adenylate cyclase
VSPEAWVHLQERCTGHREEDGHVCLIAVREALPFVPALPSLPTPEAAVALRAFIPGAIRTRLDAGQTDWLAELRRVTVLFINLPDFNDHTPLEQAQEAMMALQTNLYRYEGSINKISVDDKGASLVAALGLPPLAHEDDGIRGVRAAMAMQAELRKLGMRSAIDVTTGQAFCGSIGNAVRREYTLMGDVVNLSARLMQAAPDDILCDAPTARSATGRVQLTALTPIYVKGKQEPIAIYRPASDTTVAPAQSLRAQVKTPMVGRASERAVLAEQLALLVSSGHGSRLIVAGEAGIGKSRLLDDLIAQARAQDVTTLVGAGDAIERTTPYYPWRRVFSQLFHLEGVLDAPAAKRTHVLHQLPPDPQVLQLSPLLSTVLALEWPDNECTRGMTGKTRADKTHEILVRLLQATADQAPIVLVMEDLHWLDSGSLALLLLASQRVQPLLLVASTRPMTEPLPADYSQLLQAPTTQTLQLANMPVAEALELVCRCLEIDCLPEPVAALIRDKAEGNPFFSEELALAMRDAGLIQIADGQCQITPAAGAPMSWALPDTIQGVITSRIDRLGPSEQMTLKVASVIGREFAYRTLHDIHPIDSDKEKLSQHFDTLLALDLTPLARPMPDLAYLFKHAITHDVAYNLMLYAQRRRLHRAVAEWYEHTYASDLTPYYSVR